MNGEARPTRRAVIAAGLALLAGACRPRHHPPRAVPSAPTESAALRAAYQAELEVVAAYESAMQSAGPSARALLAPLRDDHSRHISALGQGPSLALAFAPTTSHELAGIERSSETALVAAAASAPDGPTAALLASIAASHAAHHGRLIRKPFRW